MLFYRAALPLSRQTLTFVTGIIRRHRASIGSLWRKLDPGRHRLPAQRRDIRRPRAIIHPVEPDISNAVTSISGIRLVYLLLAVSPSSYGSSLRSPSPATRDARPPMTSSLILPAARSWYLL